MQDLSAAKDAARILGNSILALKKSLELRNSILNLKNSLEEPVKSDTEKTTLYDVRRSSQSFNYVMASMTLAPEPDLPKVKSSTTRRPSLTRVSQDVLMSIFGAVAFNIMSPDDEPKVQSSKMLHENAFSFTFDSGASDHVVTLEAALALFENQALSDLRLVGVTGQQVRADLSGRLVLKFRDPKNKAYNIDLGTGHALKECPLNLLSVSKLKKAGCIIHYEEENDYFQVSKSSPRIPFREENGLFKLMATKGYVPDPPNVSRQLHAYAVANVHMATSGDLSLWHRRMRHMPKKDLIRIFRHDLVDGLRISGNLRSDCGCESCRMAKTRRRAHTKKPTSVEDLKIGEKVSSDVKSLPAPTLQGHKYVVCFVDHRSRFAIAYLMRSKTEVHHCFKKYVNEMRRLGVVVKQVQTDRGSEYFEQEGSSGTNDERHLHAFGRLCVQMDIIHVPKAVEEKEALAEAWNKLHFGAVEVMLWEARLSPNFWGDALLYSLWLYNHTPNKFLGGDVAPITAVTGKRARWDKFRVFGCDVYEHIPNNKFAKVPGLPNGRKLIFVGFHNTRAGSRVFDPETRQYYSADNVYFYENMSNRIDALRHHDQRRALLKNGQPQPLVMDDFLDSNPDAIRSLYLSPDTPPPIPPPSAPVPSSQHRGDLPWGVPAVSHDVPPPPATLIHEPHATPHGPPSSNRKPVPKPPKSPTSSVKAPVPKRSVFERLTDESFPKPFSKSAKASHRRALPASLLRPLRLLPVGKESKISVEEHAFLKFAETTDIPIKFMPNQKLRKGASFRRYQRYMLADTIRGAFELGATRADLRHDFARAFIKFPRHEPQLPGHIFCAVRSALSFGGSHILEELGQCRRLGAKLVDVHNTPVLRDGASFVPAYVFNARAFDDMHFDTRDGNSFSRVLADVYERPNEHIQSILSNAISSSKFATAQASKVLNAEASLKRKINIDFSLAPEPSTFEMTLPSVCDEHAEWKKAMTEEMESMERFGVFRRVPRSAARNRQVLGCRWVYKRKTDKFGEIYRYRSRLVAQGFRQKAGDSYDPTDIFSPVVHKDTLRLFLSICAAERLRVHQVDVKAAFLQAPLSEKIYLRAPPGFPSFNYDTNEEEILELSQAIYGLKQSSASFWHALKSHLESLGYESMLGDPCLFRKKLPDGKMILACAYVDDVTFGVSDQATCDQFMKDLRKRFVIEEDEGKPVDWLLGMAVHQDHDKGTIRMDMQTFIHKLAIGVLTEEELVKSSSVKTPMLKTPLPKLKERLVPIEAFDYLSVVGSLLHVANCVRCDVSTAVGILARHSMTPGPAHVRAVKRCIQYLYETSTLGITYTCPKKSDEVNVPKIYAQGRHPLDNGKNRLQVFADSDYAFDETRRSTMGSVIMMNGGPVSWSSVLAKTVATSTCEAEVHAAVDAVKDAVHVRQMLSDLELMSPDYTIRVEEDNAACIAQAESGLRHVRKAKHYEVKLRFLQQHVVEKNVQFNYCPTGEQLADFFTKPLEEDLFLKFRGRLLS